MSGDASILFFATLALLVVAIAFTALLRVGGIGAHAVGPGGYRGTAIVGGIVAGLLAGPGVLGQVNPELHRRAFLGGATEMSALEELRSRQSADIRAMEEAGVTPVAIEELRVEHEAARREAIEIMREDERERRGAFDQIATGFAAVCAVSGLVCVLPSGRGARRRVASALRDRGAGTAWSSIVYLLIASGAPSGVVYAFVTRDVSAALSFGLIVGVTGVSGGLRADRRWVCALAVAIGWVGVVALAPTGIALTLTVAGVAAFVLGGFVPRGVKRHAVNVMRWVGLPGLAALLAVRVDVGTVHALGGFWFFLIGAVVWCSDGRWFAGWAALRRRVPRGEAWTRSSSLVDAGAGTATLIVAMVFSGAGVSNDAVLASAVASAAVVELFRGFREFAGPVLDG